MNLKTRLYILTVCLIAVGMIAGAIGATPTADFGIWRPVFVLAMLAAIAEALGFLLPHAAVGSIAFIPYLASVLIAPSWMTVVAVVIVKITSELPRDREVGKKIFNIAQHAVSVSLAVMVYSALGGRSLLDSAGTSLLEITSRYGISAFAAFTAAIAANSILVVGAIAVSKQEPIARVLRDVRLPTLGVDILASPLIFLFAWVYVSFGAVAAVAAWVPMLGLRQLNKANLDLEQMNRELLQLMVKSIEARDPYTSGHSRRVQEYATIIARGARLPEKDVDRISQAALLHDVGKINDKYHPILTKPDRLTAEEWAVMKEHPIDGASLVNTMTRLRHLIPAIRHHHENWDGTGYPDGIAGQLIPLDARVIALADTIDAMSSERPYRPGLNCDQVRAEIVRCRGKQFDPDLSDRVLSSEVWAKLFPSNRARTPVTPLQLVKDRIAV